MKVSGLQGAALDCWVARANGWTRSADVWVDDQGIEQFHPAVCYDPSHDWALGGQIIEREKIGTNTWTGDWCAQFTLPVRHPTNPKRDPSHHCMRGDTPLIAAMRTYVASRFGDEVDEQ